jgi:hypothetical protein
MNSKFAILTMVLATAVTSAVAGMNNPVVGGQEMYPTKNIIENAVNSADHTTLVAAVKAAGLVETLEGAGPFTVFAPTNESVCQVAGRHRGDAVEAGEQIGTHQGSHLPRSGGQAQCVRSQEADQGGQRARRNSQPSRVASYGRPLMAITSC